MRRRQQDGEVEHRADPLPVRRARADWQRVSLGDVDVAWVRDSSGHTLSVNSTCTDYQEAPLAALHRQQLVGFTQAERVEEREEMLDGREALFSRWRAKLDGVPVELGLVDAEEGRVHLRLHLHPPARRLRRAVAGARQAGAGLRHGAA